MTTADRILTTALADHPLRSYLEDWKGYLDTEGNSRTAGPVSTETANLYIEGALNLLRFLDAKFDLRPSEPAEITRAHLRAYIKDHIDRNQAATTLSIRMRGQRRFFVYALREGWITESPFEGVTGVKVAKPKQKNPPTIPDETIVALLSTCKVAGKAASFADLRDLRDHAMLRLWLDTGCRRGEIAGLRLADDPRRPQYRLAPGSDLDLDNSLVRLVGKSGPRWVKILPVTKIAIVRYLKARAEHPRADLPNVWLGKRGAIGKSGPNQILRSRERQAKIAGHVHPHLFRHWYARNHLKAGAGEQALMKQMGWTDRSMVDVYTEVDSEQRAQDVHQELALAGRF